MLRTISTIEVIRLSVRKKIGIMGIGSTDRDLAEIATLDPKVQTLVWLAALEGGLFDQDEPNGASPAFFIGSRRFFERMRASLVDARMADRAVAFTQAISLERSGDDPARLELGAAFGKKADFDAAIVGYVDAEPVVAAWCARAREHLTEDDRLTALLDALAGENASDDQLMRWPEPFRALVLVGVFESEVGNGGVDQYFSNSSGDLARETVDALRVVGLPRYADVVERGIGFFPKPYPKDQETRAKAFDGSANRDDKLGALTDGVDTYAIRPAMLAYARQGNLLPR